MTKRLASGKTIFDMLVMTSQTKGLGAGELSYAIGAGECLILVAYIDTLRTKVPLADRRTGCPQCETCSFFKSSTLTNKTMGICGFNPPRVVDSGDTEYAYVPLDYGCGQHKPEAMR